MPLFLFFAASAELDALDQAVARCDRGTASPAFSAEAGRRSSFLLETYREQESIVAARLDVSQRRATLRDAGAIKASDEKKLSLEEAAIEDRQKALNDQRMLEGIRQDAMDSMRRYFLMNCPAGKLDH
ncbi:MAG TPA: hypothetical protein VFH89_10710 [Sphingomicrobium sp.]|nr:hypothetical protein [Sphingomicrobium sp.]